jgi:hypothetical protein
VVVRGVTTGIARTAPSERIEVTPLPGAAKQRNTVRFPALVTISRAMVHNNDLPNVLRALRERVFAVEGPNGLQLPPRPGKGVFEQVMVRQRADLLRELRGCQPITSKKFLEHYTGAKLRRYQKAVEQNIASGGVPKWAGYLNMFVKGEFINGDVKNDPAPRAIQPRHPRYNAALGVYIQPLEGRVYRALARLCGGPTVMKGYNADQTGRILATAWSQFTNPVGIGMDASRFDQHVSEDALRFEHSVYIGAFKEHASPEQRLELKTLLNWQVENRGIARLPEAEVRYKVVGNRMSGDMNTALGNCILMCLMVRQFCNERSIKFRLLDNGDDATVIVEEEDVERYMAEVKPWFLKLGFTMKVEEPVRVLEQVEFCQTHPVLIGGHYRMVRNPLTALSKDTTWKTPCLTRQGAIQETAARKWLGAVGECGMSLCSGVPIMQAFYTHLINAGLKSKRAVQGFGDGQSGFERMAVGLRRGPSPVTAATRHSFWLAFGILPDVQVCLERAVGALGVYQFDRRRIECDSLNLTVVPLLELNRL